MTKEIIVDSKHRLEAEIANAILNFEKYTGATVTQIDIKRTDFLVESNVQAFATSVDINVKVEVISIRI